MSELQTTVSYEQLLSVKLDIDELVPGYYIQELDPVRALETGQGNCYTKNILAAAALAAEQGVDSSLAWPDHRHAVPQEKNAITGGVTGQTRDSRSSKMTDLQIAHVALVVPRGGDPYDILQLDYGMQVTSGEVFRAEEKGKIGEYNFGHNPRSTDVSKPSNRATEAMLKAQADGLVVPTEYGESLGLVAGDWREMGDEYLTKLNLPPNNYDELEVKVAGFIAALHDGNPRPHLRLV